MTRTRKLVSILLLGLLALPAALAASALPNSTATISIDAPLERIWQLMVDVDSWPRWNPAVGSAKLKGSLAVGATFRWKNDGFTVMSTFRTIEPMKHLVWTGKAFGTTALHSWDFQSSDTGVIVRTSETFGGWLPRLMPDMLQRSLDAALPEWVAKLKAAAERRN
jgi:uncharacterized protein YndB with AHSA1/START domain